MNPATPAIDPSDTALMRALRAEGLSLEVIAEKFEAPISDVFQAIHPPAFYMPAKAWEKRNRKGMVQFGDDCIERQCPACSEFFPLTQEFWHLDKNSKDGFFYWCKCCRQEAAAANRKQ